MTAIATDVSSKIAYLARALKTPTIARTWEDPYVSGLSESTGL